MKTTNKTRKRLSLFEKILIATGIFFAIPTIYIISQIIFAYAKFEYSCSQKRSVVNASINPKVDLLKSIVLPSSASGSAISISRGGDCFDSQPYVSISKKYSMSLKGDQARSMIEDSLKSQGFVMDTRTDNRIGSNYKIDDTCHLVGYFAYYYKDSSYIQVSISETKTVYDKDSCNHNIDSTEAEFDKHTVQELIINVK